MHHSKITSTVILKCQCNILVRYLKGHLIREVFPLLTLSSTYVQVKYY